MEIQVCEGKPPLMSLPSSIINNALWLSLNNYALVVMAVGLFVHAICVRRRGRVSLPRVHILYIRSCQQTRLCYLYTSVAVGTNLPSSCAQHSHTPYNHVPGLQFHKVQNTLHECFHILYYAQKRSKSQVIIHKYFPLPSKRKTQPWPNTPHRYSILSSHSYVEAQLWYETKLYTKYASDALFPTLFCL